MTDTTEDSLGMYLVYSDVQNYERKGYGLTAFKNLTNSKKVLHSIKVDTIKKKWRTFGHNCTLNMSNLN
jgi:hypothetical protein